jgi:tRNA (adenine22-N1)-methyltransferase
LTNINLSKRLKTIGDFIPNNSKVIEIGCDHALLSIFIALYKSPLKIIASDINENALDQGITNIKKYKLENKIITKIGNGLKPIKDEDINTVIISGLGSKNIINILKNDKPLLNNIEYLILQPNNNAYKLRKEVTKLGYYFIF